jgi:nicotinate-nucleotide pyrophosphorylase (carboxylating)
MRSTRAMNNVVNDSKLMRIVEEALFEDIGLGDVTTEAIVSSDLVGHGTVLVKEAGIIAGLDVAALVFHCIDPNMTYTPNIQDGEHVTAQTQVASVDGSLASMLKAERTALNILQRMSGIATLTRKFVDAVSGTHVRITDTRKTVPGIRILDKLAVQIGGGVNHRFGLDDMILIKNNHIDAAGGISNAIHLALSYVKDRHSSLRIEVETRNLDEVRETLRHKGIHRIMLDNFSISEMKKAVDLIQYTVETEVSGNVSLDTIHAIAEIGVDVISIGALTHSPKALDISLKIVPAQHQT